MSDSSALPKSCPKCGAALPSEATDGLCPNCLMNEALQPTQVSDASKPKHSAILAPEELAPFFPQYEILRMLGRGGMGAVYLARQISLNRLVAIKILPADLGESDQNFAERFKNEAQAMAQLSHAGIVAVFDFGQSANGLLYIVMEYIEGTDVQLMLASQGRLHSAHAMAITAHVCDALQYAHSCGIIHRDIKPSNIMVGNNGVVKVADFGLAKMSQGQTTGLTQSGMAMGTPHFMAPEALTLGSAVDQRADIYAVGVMLYQMLTGRLPQGMFEMPSFQVPGLDPRYDRIVAKALRDDREQRYQAALDLRHDLDAILTQPVEKVAPEAAEVKALPPVEQRGRKKARVPGLPPPNAASQPPLKKRPLGLILTALGVIAALAAAFVYFRDQGIGPTTAHPVVNTLTFDGHRFELVNEKLTWHEAKAKAEAMGGHLAAITTKAEDEQLRQLIPDGHARREIWVGGSSQRKDGPWEWVTGEPFQHAAWSSNEPDGSGANNRFGIVLLSKSPDPLAVRWADAGVEQRHEFLVEWDDVAPATATKDAPFVNTLGMKFVPVPGTKILMCIHETRRGDYAAYVKESPGVDQLWMNPTKDGIPVANHDDQPVSNVSWTDGQAFCAWLSKKEGRRYRLPTDREWSSAAGIGDLEKEGATPKDINAGIKDVYPWGSNWPPGQGSGNYADTLAAGKFSSLPTIMGYADGHAGIAPVMSYSPNKLGVHDLGGNVWEWCEDWYDATQTDRFRRGGSYLDSTRDVLLSSKRMHTTPHERQSSEGFRCVVESTAQPVSPSPSLPNSKSSPAAATKDAPFINTLGMKFVPVPITGGPTDKQRVLFSVWETRVQDYEVFAEETKHEWPKPNFGQEPSHPVVNMSWDDAQAFCRWLTERERKSGRIAATDGYRLPNDHEWSCAVGIGEREDPAKTPQQKHNQIIDLYPWGTAWPPPRGAGNYADESAKARQSNSNYQYIPGYDDGFAWTAPVGSFAANAFGIYDLGGNAHEMCEDQWQPNQPKRTGRGGSYGMASPPRLLQLSDRSNDAPDKRITDRGFRCVLESSGPAVSPSTSLGTIKDAPFTNTLGMKFVPVPGAKVLFCVHITRMKDYAVFANAMPGLNSGWRAMPPGETWTSVQDDYSLANVTWTEAQAFCEWLSKKEGRRYRLPTDHEWSVAAGIGEHEKDFASMLPRQLSGSVPNQYPWGEGWPPPKGAGNFSDISCKEKRPNLAIIEGYEDGYANRSPVMRFPPNQFGLYDMGGNLRQWCEDWYDEKKTERVVRGSSWYDHLPEQMLSSYRGHWLPLQRRDTEGFRCVVEPEPDSASRPADLHPKAPPPTGKSVTETGGVTKDAPFTNTLGMKFVPVPINGGPTAAKRVLFSVWDTRVQDYLAFARENNKVDGRWQEQQKDGVPAGREFDHPVVGVNWEDAQAFCRWLTAKETAEGKLPQGMQYRLPSDEEWSWAVGLTHEPGATPAEKTDKNTVDFPWGIGFPPPGKRGNYADETFHAKVPKHWVDREKDLPWITGYNDGYATTSPVGSFPANAHGLYDMGGNVWQWCEDWFDKDQKQRVLRGASWDSPDRNTLLSSRRRHSVPQERGSSHGFRCVLAAAGDTASASPTLPVSTASKESPFTNTLGMKFVPVPINGEPSEGNRVLFSVWETRVQDYGAFAKETKREWLRTDFVQGPTHPAVKVSWDDAQAFCVWLTEKERKEGILSAGARYRLPTDHEWSSAAGIGEKEDAGMTPAALGKLFSSAFPWGNGWPPPTGAGNYAGEEMKPAVAAGTYKSTPILAGYNDGFVETAPAGSFPANRLGLHDLGGNAWEWCEDWYDERKTERVMRGASWLNRDQSQALLTVRGKMTPDTRNPNVGFRCVLDDSKP